MIGVRVDGIFLHSHGASLWSSLDHKRVTDHSNLSHTSINPCATSYNKLASSPFSVCTFVRAEMPKKQKRTRSEKASVHVLCFAKFGLSRIVAGHFVQPTSHCSMYIKQTKNKWGIPNISQLHCKVHTFCMDTSLIKNVEYPMTHWQVTLCSAWCATDTRKNQIQLF